MTDKNTLKGFTLIEILVVFGILGVIMAAVTDVLVNTFKANSRVQLTNRLVQEGNFVINEIRKNVLTSDGKNINCPIGVGDSSFYYANMVDNQVSTVICSDRQSGSNGKIASNSASGNFDLSSDQVMISGCASFVTCDTLPYSSDISNISIGFTLSVGNSNAGDQGFASKDFKAKFVIRN